MKALRIVNYRLRRMLGAEWETCTVDGFTIRYSLRDHFIGSALYFDRVWEPHVGNIIRSMRLDGAAAIDVGAHVGIHTLQMARAAGPGGRVAALEPEKRNLAMLRRNLALNGFANVEVIAAAAGESRGDARLQIDEFNRGGHRVRTDAQPPASQATKPVTVTTVDAVAAGLGEVRLVKIDAEGSELAVLRGMEETIARNPAIVLLVEVSADSAPRATVEHLQAKGFDGWEVQRNRAIPLQRAEVYDRLVGDHVEIVVSRDRRAIDDLVRRAY